MSLYAPQPRRPLSRASLATTLTHYSSPPSSSSSRMPRSNGTSATSPTEWSEDGTEMPQPGMEDGGYKAKVAGWNDEPPLIDFDEPTAETQYEKPADRLKMLLKQMEAEVEETKTRQEAVRSASPEVRSTWRNGRRGVVERARDDGRYTDRPEQTGSESDREEGDDSPPTPPLRITNPYLARRQDRTPGPAHNQQRITSRAAVLRNSLARTPDPPAPRTPLETFIASHHLPISDPSSSRSINRSTSSTSSRSSRKGKERASETRPTNPVRRSHTPRKTSIELPPDNSAVFAEEAASLDGRGKEFDMSSSSAEPPWDEEDSTMDEPPPTISHRRGSSSTPNGRGGHDEGSGRFSRVLKRSVSPATTNVRDEAEDTSLPALPEPSLEEEEEPVDTVSSRQASLFRSPSKSRSFRDSPKLDRSNESSTSRSPLRKVSPNVSRFKNAGFVPPEATQPVLARNLTPVKASSGSVSTPHPPGRWYTPSQPSGIPAPLSAKAPKQEEGDVSIHRLRVSPGKKASPKRVRLVQEPTLDEASDSSFLGRIPGLSRMIAKSHPLPRPSSAIFEAKDALAHAAQASTQAREEVEKTQTQFLEALSAAQMIRGSAAAVAKQTWSWGNWAWWMGVEVLLIWGVFRVTLDYATSAQYLAVIDPFSTSTNPFALSVPLPNALSEFIIPRRGSANFFDLMEKLDLWRRLNGLGVLSTPAVVGGIKMLGGVPT